MRDPAVIKAYVRGRQAIEEDATLADSLAPTGDADKDRRAKKRYLCIARMGVCETKSGCAGLRRRLRV